MQSIVRIATILSPQAETGPGKNGRWPRVVGRRLTCLLISGKHTVTHIRKGAWQTFKKKNCQEKADEPTVGIQDWDLET